MPRFPKIASLAAMSCLVPLLALQAQQPPPRPASPRGEPTESKSAATRSEAVKSPAADAIERIKEEELKHSQVMATLSYLTDVIGPRLTGSPNMKRANEWTRARLEAWARPTPISRPGDPSAVAGP